MYKTKIIIDNNINVLENEINKFLEQNEKKISKVMDIKMNIIPNASYIMVATIIYKTDSFKYNEEKDLSESIRGKINLAKSIRHKDYIMSDPIQVS